MIGYDYDAREKEAVERLQPLRRRATSPTSRAATGTATTQPLWMCRRCGLGFLSPRLTAAEYGHFYEDVYRPLVCAYHGRRIDAETVQVDQRGYAASSSRGCASACRRRRGR